MSTENADFKGALLEAPQFKLNKAHYDNIIAAKDKRTLVYEEVLKPHTGDAFFVKAGQVIRMEQRHDITQIADWWWVSPDLSVTHQPWISVTLGGASPYIQKYSRIWSTLDPMRPIATMVADEVPDDFAPPGYARHFWGWHCSPTWHQAQFPHLSAGHNACHVNGTQGFHRIPAIHAIEDEAERKATVQRLVNHANYQTFQVYGWFHGDKMNIYPDARHSPSVPHGTGVEFYAEMDAYVVISSCPWVNQTVAVGDIEPVPLYISVWETGIAPLDPPAWKDWQTPFYEAVVSGEKDISPRTPESYSRP